MRLNTGPIFSIAIQEFNKALLNPVVILICIIVMTLAFFNGAGGFHMLERLEGDLGDADVFLQGYSQIVWDTAMILSIVSAFLGLITIASDRHMNRLDVLSSKPIYRWNIILGKFLGLNLLIFIIVALIILVTTFLLIIFFREPLNFYEFFIRIFNYILVLFMECSLTLGIAMMIGVVFKNLLGAASIVVTGLYLEWFSGLIGYNVNLSWISPNGLFWYILNPVEGGMIKIFDTSFPFMNWLSAAMPYLAIMTIEIIIVVLISSIVFSRCEGA